MKLALCFFATSRASNVPKRPHAECFDSVRGVVHRAGWTGKMKHIVHSATLNRSTNILFQEFETRLVAQMFEIGETSGEQVVRGYNRVAFTEQSITKMRTEKACSPGNQRACEIHEFRRYAFDPAGPRRLSLPSVFPDGQRYSTRIRALT